MVPLDEETRPAFEERITREARRFQLKPLLDLLIAKGYPREEILFEGTHEGSAATLIEGIRFQAKPVRGVLITLNLGLLGDNTLLPSYFFHVIEGTNEPERFFDFIRFFDHRLITNLIRALYPEEDTSLYHDWSEVLRAYFRMLGPASVSTMHWLACQYFPDLGVEVRRWAFSDSSEAHAFVTGESKLDGSGILGRHYQSDAVGLGIDLFADEETDARGRAWPNIVRQRLRDQLFPLLAPFRIPLRVRLTVRFHASWARVDVPFARAHGYLGYERIRGDAESGHTTVIFRGVTGARRQA
ncbi:MAG: hypothetical protein QM820_08975 [Minicystis sp.]